MFGNSATPAGAAGRMPIAQAGSGAGMGGAASARDPVAIDACGAGNAAGLSEAEVRALIAGSGGGAGMNNAMRWLYPYDGTVFPRGMLAPTLMWSGAEGSAVYVHIHASGFDYRGCLKTTGPQQLQLPQDVWQQAGDQSNGPADPFVIELSVQGTSGPIGPIQEQIVIAQATLKGSIYYNSYSGVGAIYRIPPGGKAELFLGGTGCYGCHSVSANGSRMVSHIGADPGGSYELTPATQPNPPALAAVPGSGFSGVSPDGSVYVASAHPAGQVRPQGTPADAFLINDAALFATDTGAAIAGAGIPAGAMMPMFSPDGRLLAFNDFAEAVGRGLAIMDFDPAARAASNRRVVFTDMAQYPGWPFFLPDNKALVFARGDNPQFSGAGAGVFPGTGFLAPASDLYIVDVQRGTSTLLAKAMGLSTPQDMTGYLPFGTEDLHKHYYPTVSPVAAGGYFWVFFDSIRNYGNQGVSRQLWGSALRISPEGVYEGDPSHPSFYVTGQEFLTGNHRAFTALDACKMNGETCTSGTDCCGGFCFVPPSKDQEFGTEPVGSCTSDVPMCAKTNERCASSADCCPPTAGEPANKCIAGFCAYVPPVQ